MDSHIRYRPAGTHIVHDRFDDEVVIINLNDGCYYSLRQSAADIWDGVAGGLGLEGILGLVGSRFDGDTSVVRSAVEEFLSRLMAEDLAAPGDGDGPEGPAPAPAGKKPPFVAPLMTKYEDQKEILLLDPIHEVGDLGWPEKK